MGLPSGDYSLQCWHSTQNPSEINRPRLLYQCLQLIKALRARFDNSEIAIPSTADNDKKGIEICIVYPAGHDLFADISTFLTESAISMGLDYHDFIKQDVGLTRYFNQAEMDNISLLATPIPDTVTEQVISEVFTKALNFEGYRMNDEWRDAIPSQQRGAAFQITRPTLERLHRLEGEDLAGEIRSIMDAINVAATSSINTSTAVITMIASGASSIAKIPGVSELVGSTLGEVLLLWNLGSVTAAVGLGAAIAAVAVVLAGTAWLMLKDASNVLLVVNDTQNDILPMREHIENGERRAVPEMIPAAVPGGDFVPSGLFFYSKYQIFTKSIGAFGSAFGVSCAIGDKNFSVGMDCPNSLLGGRNSIYVISEEDAKKACDKALGSGTIHDWTNRAPRIDVKIAKHMGQVNWGRAVAM